MSMTTETLDKLYLEWSQFTQARTAREIALQDVVAFIDRWVSNPVGAYSVSALDGLFGMTRDKIAALKSPTPGDPSPLNGREG